MPRIFDTLVHATAYLYRDAAEAERGHNAGGSGFIVLHGENFYVVTCAHVALMGAPIARVLTHSGDRNIRDDLTWIRHPNDDDVAVAWLAPLAKDHTDWYFSGHSSLVPEWFVTPSDFVMPSSDELAPLASQGKSAADVLYEIRPVGVGDDTVTIGRFLGRDGGETNVPTARFGNLATDTAVMILFKQSGWELEQECFLVEARSFNGYSGSAVYTYRELGTWDGTPNPIGLSPDEFRVLGIDCGHLPLAETHGEVALPSKPRHKTNAGIMTVVPAWKIVETIESPAMVTCMDKRERDLGALAEFDPGTSEQSHVDEPQ